MYYVLTVCNTQDVNQEVEATGGEACNLRIHFHKSPLTAPLAGCCNREFEDCRAPTLMRSAMASLLIPAALAIVCSILSASSAPANPSPWKEEIDTALGEMQSAGYFSFAMLIRMVQDGLRGNVTFLMPTDKQLSFLPPPEDGVLEFLSRHSIPSPLGSEELTCLPPGTTIPTMHPGFVVNISSTNDSRRGRLYLNDIEVVSQDVCVAGSSIRCHGMNGVLGGGNTTSPRGGPDAQEPVPAPAPDGLPARNGQHERSGDADVMYGELVATVTSFILLLC